MRKPRTMISHVTCLFLFSQKQKNCNPFFLLFTISLPPSVLNILIGFSTTSVVGKNRVKVMEKRVMMFILCMLVVVLERNGVCYCFEGGDQSPSTMEKAKKSTVKLMTGDAIDRDSSSSSWVNWARDKLAEGFRGKQVETSNSGAAQSLMDSAGSAAIKTKNTISNTASEAAELASEKAGPAMNLAYMKAGEASNMASKKAGDAANLASEKAGAVKETIADGTNRVMDVGDQTSDSATETTSEEAKTNYEAAKEKASQATGDLGAKMRSEL